MLTWKRTDTHHDFTLYRQQKPIGRVYRHTDGKRWQWFWQGIPGDSGICDSKGEALKEIAVRAAI